MIKSIRDNAVGFEISLDILVNSEIIPTYAKFLSYFSKNIDHFLIDKFPIYINK